MVTDSHSILGRWRNHFSQLLNVHGVNDVWQTEIHTVESLVPESSASEKLKRHKSPGIDQAPAEMIKALRSINLLILSGIRGNCLRRGRIRLL